MSRFPPAPNGDLIAANGDAINSGGTPNDLVEFNRVGMFVGNFQVDSGASGAAFGIAMVVDDGKLHFAGVNDNANTVEVFTLTLGEVSRKYRPGFTGNTHD